MASRRFPQYPSDVDSDDEGSIGSDWDSDSELDDDDLTYHPQPRTRKASAVPGTPPPRYPSVSSLYSNAAAFFRPPSGYVSVPACVVCKSRPQYSQNGKHYPTCGLTCASMLPLSVPSSSSSRSGHRLPRDGMYRSSNWGAMGQYPATSSRSPFHQRQKPLCVVCKKQAVYKNYVTCGRTCIEKLCKDGPSDTTMCTYCHRRPKFAGKEQCGQTCADKAKDACLLCKSRPKNKKYHFCGKMCKRIATKSTPLLLEIPKDHSTYEMVENKFKSAWKTGTPQTITKIFKVIEDDAFLKPYDAYRQRVGPKETYLYHGTKRQCQLGVSTTTLCASSTCAICGILKTSFKVEIANPGGTFGQGVYNSSASNMAFGYCGAGGSMLLNKVVLGNSMQVASSTRNCPAGYNSIVYDPQGAGNQTIVYSNDAIRPVFMIMFQ